MVADDGGHLLSVGPSFSILVISPSSSAQRTRTAQICPHRRGHQPWMNRHQPTPIRLGQREGSQLVHASMGSQRAQFQTRSGKETSLIIRVSSCPLQALILGGPRGEIGAELA